MQSVSGHDGPLDNDHADLKIDLGRKLNEILDAADDKPRERTVGKILNLLELETHKSFLTKRDHALLRDDISDLLQSVISLTNAEARSLNDRTEFYMRQVNGDHRRLYERMDTLRRQGAA